MTDPLEYVLRLICICFSYVPCHKHMLPDFGKPTKLSQIVFLVITILSIEATMVLSC